MGDCIWTSHFPVKTYCICVHLYLIEFILLVSELIHIVRTHKRHIFKASFPFAICIPYIGKIS